MKISKLHPYQEECLREVEAFQGRALLGLDMGLGKSAISLHYLHRHPEIKQALVVCPASLKYNWRHEASLHVGLPAEILSSQQPPKRQGLAFRSRLLIINYNILAWWYEWLLAYEPQLIIWDEGHYLKNRQAKWTRTARRLSRVSDKLLVLSGTPLINRPAELWPVLNMLRPDVYPNFQLFAKEHCAPRLMPWGAWRYDGAVRLPELHQGMLKTLLVRRRKVDVLKDLPPKSRQVINLELEDRSEYQLAVRDFTGWLYKQSPALARKAKRAEQVTRLGYLKRLAAQLKLKQVLAWLDDVLLETDEKILVFAVHKKVIRSLVNHYHGQCVQVDGSITGKRREQAFDQFRSDPKVRLLVGNIQAAGVGWNAKGVSTVVFVELPWTPGEVVQAEDRCYGLGRGKEGQRTDVYFLVAEDTIEEDLCKLLQKKQKIMDTVLDGKRAGVSLDIFDLLAQTLLKGLGKKKVV